MNNVKRSNMDFMHIKYIAIANNIETLLKIYNIKVADMYK